MMVDNNEMIAEYFGWNMNLTTDHLIFIRYIVRTKYAAQKSCRD